MKTGFRNTLWMGAALALICAGGCGDADSMIDLTVGTYGEHIYLYSFDCRSLEFTSRRRVEAMDASYVLEEGDMIFAASECGNGSGVCSFHKGADGTLRKTSDLRQTGNDERHMMTADYSGDSVSVFPIKDGALKDRCAQLTFSGSGPVTHRRGRQAYPDRVHAPS